MTTKLRNSSSGNYVSPDKADSFFKNKYFVDIAAVIIITISVCIMFFPLLRGEVISTNDVGTNDLLYFSFPIRALYAEALKAGEILQWTPYIFSGFPVFAEGQNGFLYPFNVITCYIFNPVNAMNWFIIFHSILFGFGVYLFLKKLSMNGWNVIAMGIAAALCGSFTTGHTRHLNILSVIALTPYLFIFAESYVRKFKITSALSFGAVLGLMLLTNHPQFSFICGFFSFLYLFGRMHFASRDKTENPLSKPIGFFVLKLIIFLSVSFTVSIIIGYVQLRDTLQLSGFSIRTQDQLTSQYTGMGSLPLNGIFTFLYPYYNGNAGNNTYKLQEYFLFWEHFYYIGIVLFLLAVTGAVKYFRNKTVVIFILMFFLSYIFALGENLGVYKIFSFFPVIKSFRFPSRWFFGAELSLIFLSSYGFRYFIEKISFVKKITDAKQKNKNQLSVLSNAGKMLKAKPYLAGIILSVIAFTDMYIITGKGVETADISVFYPQGSRDIELLKRDSNARYYTIGEYELCERVFTLSNGWEGSKDKYKIIANMLPPNQPSYFHISSVGGYTNLCPHYIYEVWGDADHQGIIRKTASLGKDKKSLIPSPVFLKLLKMWGIKNIKSLYKIEGGLQLISDTLGIKHYFVPDAMPRTWIVKNLIPVSGDNKNAVEIFLDSNFVPNQTAVINGNAPVLPDGSENSYSQIIEAGNHFVRLKAASAGMVILSDSYYPDWKAKINGTEVPVYRVNNSMRGIVSPAAGTEIELYYDNGNILFFVIISYLAIVLIFLFTFVNYFRETFLYNIKRQNL